MRIVLYLALLLSEVRPIPGQETIVAYCPQTARLSGNPTDQWFAGTIGAGRVRVYVRRSDQEVVGLYYDLSDWKPILLGGQWTKEGNVRMTTSPVMPDSRPVGTLRGVLSSTGDFIGSVVSNDGTLSAQKSVAMKQVPQPSCSGAGSWQTFSNLKWPITFSYPASWHVEIAEADVATSSSNEKLVLACADPMTLGYNMTIEFLPEEMRDDNRVADFIRFMGGTWMYGL